MALLRRERREGGRQAGCAAPGRGGAARRGGAPAAAPATGSGIQEASAVSSGAGAASAREVSSDIHSSADLLAAFGDSKAADAPMCMTCGTKMRPAGSCYVGEGCGSTSGCS